MRLHPEWGAEMVASIPGLEAVALIVRLHHERPDGAGYPHGLVGDQIPIASRIVSVCAAYGVMTKSWPHRDAVDVDTALKELRDHAGTQFDSDVVEALASCLWTPCPWPPELCHAAVSGIADRVRVRGWCGDRGVTLRAARAAGGALGGCDRRAAPAARRGDRARAVVHVRDRRARLCNRRARAAGRPRANAGHRRAARVRPVALDSTPRRPARGRDRQARAGASATPRRCGRGLRIGSRARAEPRARVRAVRRADPRRGDHGVRGAVVHGGTARRGARLRHRHGGGALRR